MITATSVQPALPTIDMRPVCPLCRRAVNILGQYDPYYGRAWLCRDCTLARSLPVELWEPHPRKAGEYQINRDPALAEWREKRIEWGEEIRTAVSVRSGTTKAALYGRWRHQLRHGTLSMNQMNLAICPTCGCVNNLNEWGHWSDCQHCADEGTLNSLWQCRGIYAGDDFETMMDRIYKAFPGLFERGLLPDRWILFMYQEGKTK